LTDFENKNIIGTQHDGCWVFPAETRQSNLETMEPDPDNAGVGNRDGKDRFSS
jgi:hypothetical protein